MPMAAGAAQGWVRSPSTSTGGRPGSTPYRTDAAVLARSRATGAGHEAGLMPPGIPDGWDRLAADLPEWAWPPPPSAWLEPVTRAGTDDVHPAHGPFVWQASGGVKPASG